MYSVEHYCGCLFGLAVGDALGTALEFELPDSLAQISDIVGGGPFNLKPGQWTDDTSMALCLAESLIKMRRFEPVDQLTRYCRWYRQGYLSSTGQCFDIGRTIRESLEKFEQTGEPYCGLTDEYSASNGCLMRLAPIPLFYARIPQQAIEKSGESARTTHGLQITIDACRYFGALLVGAIMGVNKSTLLSKRFSPALNYWETNPLVEEIDVKSLEAALWAFYNSNSFKEGALKAVNLGNDADTTGAVYGQLAGAFYGESAIPSYWLDKLFKRYLIKSYAVQLAKIGKKVNA